MVFVIVVMFFRFFLSSLCIKKPDIILISIDTLRADHLRCYGYGKNTSLNIDALVKDAVIFQNAFSQAPVTAPAHMSIFTSLTPAVHRVRFYDHATKKFYLDKSIKTLPMVLKEKGYFTVGLHAGRQVDGALGFDRGFDQYSNWEKALRAMRSQDRFFARVNEVRQAIIKSREKDKPLFLFLHSYVCHDPYLNGPEELRLRFLTQRVEGLPVRSGGILRGKDFFVNRESFWKNVDLSNSGHKAHIIALYDGEIYCADCLFGEVVRILKEEKRYDNSIIIFVSDHGEEFYEHKGKSHWKLFIETLHVPMIIKFPQNQYGGQVVSQEVRTMDIMPTLFDFLGIKSNNFMQGISFLPLVTGKGDYHPFIVSYASPDYAADSYYVRFLSSSFIYSNQPSGGELEWLFDAKNDSQELNNIVMDNPKVLSYMRQISQTMLAEDKAVRKKLCLADKPLIIDSEKEPLEQLKSLGYAQ